MKKDNNDIQLIANKVLYPVNNDVLNKDTCENFKKEFSALPKERQEYTKRWIVERLYEIDTGCFDTKKYLNDPIRFYFDCYRHILFTYFKKVNLQIKN